MNEYRVDVKVRNNLILTAITNAGYKNISQFCDDNGLLKTSIFALINLKETPLRQDGTFTAQAQKLMDALCALPEDLWTQDQMYSSLNSNLKSMTMNETQLEILTYGNPIEPKTLEDFAETTQIRKVVNEVLDTLTPREAKVLRLRNGMEDNSEGMTLEEVADKFHITRERIRQIEAKGLRKMRERGRVELLKPIIEE